MDPARDRRLAQQDAPRVELRLPRDPQRGDAALAAIRLAHAVRGQGPAVDGPRGSRSGSSARSRRGIRRRSSACASSRRPWRSATPSSSSPTRRRPSSAGRCSRPSSARPACPRACCRSSSAAPTSARRSSPTPTSRSCRSPARPPSGGGSASWPAACSRRSRSSSAATTRSSSSTMPTSTPPTAAGAFSAFQFQGQVCFAAGRHLVHRTLAGAYIDALAEKAKRLRLGDPYREDVQLGPIVNEKQLRPRRRHRPALDRRRGAGSLEGGTHEGLFYRPDRARPRSRPDLPAWTDEIFGPVAPITIVRHRRRGARARQRQRLRPGRLDLHALARRAAWRSPTGCGPAWSTSTTARSTTRRSSRSAAWATPATAAATAARPASTRFTEWQWVTVRDEPPTFPF